LTRNRRGALGRAVVGYIGRKFCGYENRAIADHFKREPAALSFGIKNLEKSLEENKVFAKTIEKLERNLARNKNII
jgi:chromosomal replication initiation ATPase DnaA